jgi:dihydrofolate synthase/folylpolyglutamate synthase
MLGNTLPLIAGEKAGIIKPTIPVIIGESHLETAPVFIEKATKENANITFADKVLEAQVIERNYQKAVYNITSESYNLDFQKLLFDLTGTYQIHNLKTALLATTFLQKESFNITPTHIRTACADVQNISKLLGRWQVLSESPLTICDSGHNGHGLQYTINALEELNKEQIHFVFGSVKDKDLSLVFPLLPKNAIYYFCKADIPRGLDAATLQQLAKEQGLNGRAYASVRAAFEMAQTQAGADDCVFVGGSIFVVGEVL